MYKPTLRRAKYYIFKSNSTVQFIIDVILTFVLTKTDILRK